MVRQILRVSIRFVVGASAITCTELVLPDPPNPPTDVAATLSSPTSVQLTWSERPAGEHIGSYLIYRNGNLIGESTSPGYTDANLAEAVTLRYTVASKSVRGEKSAASEPVSITTRDVTPPRIIQSVPANGDGPLNVRQLTIVLVANEGLDSTTVNSANIDVRSAAGAQIPGTFVYQKSVGYIQFAASNGFPAATTITVTVGKGLKDASGNGLAVPYVSSFTTNENVRPKVIATTPANGATNVPVSTVITVTYSEPMKSGFALMFNDIDGLRGVLSTWNQDKTVQTFIIGRLYSKSRYTFSSSFPPQDLAGNDLEPFTFSFTTEDAHSPAVVSTSPANGDVDVDVNTSVRVTFNTSMDPTSITTSTFRVFGGGGQIPGVINYDDATKSATYTFSAPLAAATRYSFFVQSNVHDITGREMEITFNSSFTTR